MKYISMVLLCAAVIMAGMNSAAENRSRIATLRELAALFGFLSEKIAFYDCGFLDALGYAVSAEADGMLSFPRGTVSEYTAENELIKVWDKAVQNDCCLKKTGTDCIRDIKELARFFDDGSRQGLSDACRRLSERFASEEVEAERKKNTREQLTLTFSVLGAVVVFIIMI